MDIKYNTLGPDGLWGSIKQINLDRDKIIPRESLKVLQKNLGKRFIDVICGPRQSGKTTLLYLLMTELNRMKVYPEYIRYINLDTLPDRSIFDNPARFYQAIRESHRGDDSQKIYLLLDEVQRLKNPGLFLKAIYDSYPQIKIIVSGSSSLEMRAGTKEFLTGRKRDLHLLPLSYREVIRSLGKLPEELWEEKLTAGNIAAWEDWEKIYGQFLSEQMMRMAVYGGYPGVFMETNPRDKEETLYELYTSYVKKDISDFLRVENISHFNNLIRALAAQIGGMINISAICSLIGGNRITVGKYLNILEETYVIKQLPPLVGNKRNEIRYARKCYFCDCGLRNISLSQFEKAPERSDFGNLLENMVAVEISKSLSPLDSLYYWRTKTGAEVDFVLRSESRITPIEVKFLSANVGTLPKSFYSFIDSYQPEKVILLNRDRFGHFRKKTTDVFYIPAHWFILRGKEILEESA